MKLPAIRAFCTAKTPIDPFVMKTMARMVPEKGYSAETPLKGSAQLSVLLTDNLAAEAYRNSDDW